MIGTGVVAGVMRGDHINTSRHAGHGAGVGTEKIGNGIVVVIAKVEIKSSAQARSLTRVAAAVSGRGNPKPTTPVP